MSEPKLTDRPHARIGVEVAKLRVVKPRTLLVRFGFGAMTSAVAAVIGLAAEPRAGGLFLAFPAILMATITLIEDEEGSREAREDARGAIVGAVGLATFAALAAVLFGRLPSPAVLAVATSGWVIVAVGIYVAVWRPRRRT
jgi:Protein of unknown function (DUF3147)